MTEECENREECQRFEFVVVATWHDFLKIEYCPKNIYFSIILLP
jgi:hypothetical protein